MKLSSRRAWAFAACALLAACTNSHFTPSSQQLYAPEAQGSGSPANGATGLPANGATGMPAGDFLACNLQDTPGQVDCTIAINLNVAPNANPSTPASLLPGLHPADLQTAYAMPASRHGGTVAIVDAYDDPTAEADLAVYRTAFGLPACSSSSGCFRRVNEYGATNSYPMPNTQWQEEMSLDMDMVSAICPNCKILLVEADTPSISDLGTAVDTAASLGAVAISNSYYAKEWKNERSQDVHYKHSGVAIVVSSGDEPGAFFPASSLSVTSVGGTTLSLGDGTRSESPWGPAGQGCSVFEPKPAFQPNTGCKTRSSVDMAAVADPQTGVTIWDAAAGGWLEAGGTSVGSPLIAAAYALSGNPRGPAYSYSHAGGFYDIAPAGYDLATGLGSPQGISGL